MDTAVATKLHLTDYHPPVADMMADEATGLTLPQKSLSPKYFYDAHGSKLFDDITELPEYYLTRTELGIMRAFVDEMTASIGDKASVIEFGSGSSTKIRILLDSLDEPVAYIPVEISRSHLMQAAQDLADDYPGIEIIPVCADFTRPFELPDTAQRANRNLVFFPGSTIGNFSPDGALQLLKIMNQTAGENGAVLIGADLQKETALLEAAYNDKAGVTAAFNLNLLVRINRELDADFDLDGFRHQAIYNEKYNRIEMHLVSKHEQSVQFGEYDFLFSEDEHILTECSHKYDLNQFADLVAKAGFRVEQVWTDDKDFFSVQYLIREREVIPEN